MGVFGVRDDFEWEDFWSAFFDLGIAGAFCATLRLGGIRKRGIILDVGEDAGVKEKELPKRNRGSVVVGASCAKYPILPRIFRATYNNLEYNGKLGKCIMISGPFVSRPFGLRSKSYVGRFRYRRESES